LIPEVVAGILVGGQGTRMDSPLPKHLVAFGEETLVDPILRAAQQVCSTVVLVGEGPGKPGVQQVEDDPGSQGPLAGILGLMGAYPDVAVLVLACDMPLMTVGALQWLLEQRREDRLAIFPRTRDGRVQPLGALYEAGSRADLMVLAQAGHLGPRSLAERSGFAAVDVPEHLQDAWSNVNDMRALTGLLESRRASEGER